MNWERWSWLLATGSAALLSATDPWLADAIGDGRALGTYGLGGIGIGWLWYHLYPRSLSERLFGFACLFAVVVVAAGVLGSDGGSNETVVIAVYLGVIAGLTFNEQSREGGTWMRQRRTALTSRESMKDLS